MKTNSTTTVSKAKRADLIATLWFSFGFKPRESLMLAGLVGRKNRVGVMLRVDLPGPDADEPDLRSRVRSSLEPIMASPARGVIAVVASEQALGVGTPPIVPVLVDETAQARLVLFDVLGLTSSAYRSLICLDEHCCPREGQPVENVLQSRAAASHVLNGDRLVESEDDLIADIRPQGDGLAGERTAGERFAADHPGDEVGGDGGRSGRAWLTPGARRRWWEIWLTALAAVRGSVSDPAVPLHGFSAALHDPFLRDAVVIYLLGAGQPEVDDMLGAAGAAAEAGLAAGHGPGPTGSPDFAVLAGAARVAGPGAQAPSVAVLALLSWYTGQAGRSRLLVGRALADVPEFSLADLVEHLLIARIPPPWLRNSAFG
jgi:hypothetical protein